MFILCNALKIKNNYKEQKFNNVEKIIRNKNLFVIKILLRLL